MPKELKNKTANFEKISDDRFKIEVTEIIEEVKTQDYSIKELRDSIEAKQKAIEANNESLLQKTAQIERSNSFLSAQIAALNDLIDEAKSQGIVE